MTKKTTAPIPVKETTHTEEMLSFVIKTTTGVPESRQAPDPFYSMYSMGGAISPPIPPEKLLRLSEENAIHAACIAAKVSDAVGRGWKFVPDDEDTEESKIPKEMFEKLEDVTPLYTWNEMLYQAADEMETIGWGAWEIVRAGKEIGAIYPLPAHTLRATKDPDKFVQIKEDRKSFFKLFGSDKNYNGETGEEGDFGDKNGSEAFIFKGYSPRTPHYGIPDWVACIPAIAELTAIREYNVSFFSSGGTADRWIHVAAEATGEAKRVAQDVYEQLKDSTGRAHVTIVTYGADNMVTDLKFLSQSASKDAAFIQRRQDLVKEVLMAHRVPPYKIGWAELGSLGGSAAKEMLESYRSTTVEPIQTIMEDRLNHHLFGDKGFNLQGFHFEFEDLSFEETELNMTLAKNLTDSAIITLNEGRQKCGYDPSDDEALDKYYMKGQPLTPEETETPASVGGVIDGLKQAIEAALAGTPLPAVAPEEPVAPAPAAEEKKPAPAKVKKPAAEDAEPAKPAAAKKPKKEKPAA